MAFKMKSGMKPSFKMMGASPYKKPLVGNQDKLPEHLQHKILDSPAKQTTNIIGEDTYEAQKNKNKDPYIIFQLHTSRSGEKNKSHYLEPWYVKKLINTLSQNHKCKIISTPELLDEYVEFEGNDNVEIVIGEIKHIINEIKDASLFLGIDSGFRFIGYSFSVPAILFGTYYNQPNWCAPFHQIRWSLFPEQCFPLHHDYKHISSLALNILENKAISIYPFIKDFDMEMVKRKWTINKEKSVLEEIDK